MKRWTRRIAGIIATVALLGAGGAVAFALKPPPDPAVNGLTLFRSVEDAAGSVGAGLDTTSACVGRPRPGTWRCDIGDTRGSGGAGYRVTVTGAGPCWTARLVDDYSEEGMPGRVAGCVRGERWVPWDLVH